MKCVQFARVCEILVKCFCIASTLTLLSLLGGCISTDDPSAPLSAVRVYPMGPSQFMVTCVDSPGYCANQATRLCPQGFDVTSNTTNPRDYGRMTMIIRCK
jgi:hypothetical protein